MCSINGPLRRLDMILSDTRHSAVPDLDVILAEADRFVRVSVAPDVERDHTVAAAGEVPELVPPHIPELGEPVDTNL